MRPASVAAFGLSLFLSFSTAYAVDLDPTMHRAVPGDFNGDGLIDELLQPLNGTLPSGIFYRDAAGDLSIAGQVWQPKYLGLDWGTDSSTLYTADFQGAGRSDILLQPLKSGANGALLFPTPDGQFLNIGQTIRSPYLGFDWSAESHAIHTGRFDGGPQSEVLLQAASHGGLSGIVHPDSQGRLTQLVETWPDDFLGIPWDAATVTLYVGDFNGDGQDDLLVQVDRPDPSAQAYYLLLADTAGKFSTIKQSWGLDAFGGNWNPATHKLSVQTINGVTSVVLTATDGSSNYVFQANSAGTFDKPAAQWTGTTSAADALKSHSSGGAKKPGSMSVVVSAAASKPVVEKTATTQTSQAQTLSAGNSPSTPDSTGELAGSGGVSGGAGTYNIPLDLPPGIAGMQPSLSLDYSSKGGNGDLGMGWSLSGLSAIHRCPSTQAQDRLSAGVNYSSTDRLCLDGQHLVYISGGSGYGYSGAIYRTEMDSGVLVKEENGPVSSGGSTFEVDYQDGRKAFYGYDGSANGATVVPTGAPAPLVWAISQEQDLSLNNITYQYSSGGGEYHIAAITYTGNSGSATTGSRQVQFTYSPRTDSSVSYLAGGESQETRVLTAIRTVIIGGTKLREYDLGYAASGATGRSLLQSVQECGYDSAQTEHCLPATTFTWQNALNFSYPQPMPLPHITGGNQTTTSSIQAQVAMDKDYFGDGRKAMNYAAAGVDEQLYWTDGSQFDLTTQCGHPAGIGSGDVGDDFNDDGRAEVLCHDQNGNLNLVPLTLNNGIPTGGAGTATSISANQQVLAGDFTGDGMEDLLTAAYSTNSNPIPLKLYVNSASPGAAPQFNDPTTLQPTLQVNGSGASDTLSHAGDLDGNGISDLFITPVGQTYPDRVLFMYADPSQDAVVTFTAMGLASSDVQPTFMDINGDGLPDAVFNAPATNGATNPDGSAVYTWQYQLNQGNRTFAAVVDTGVAVAPGNPASQTVAADIDNDGSQELLFPDVLVSQYCWTPLNDTHDTCPHGGSDDRSIYKWGILKFVPSVDQNGNVVYVPQSTPQSDRIIAPIHAMQTGDLDGNGLTAAFADYSPFYLNAYYVAGTNPYSGYNAVRNITGAPDLMTGAVSGLGRTSQWQYRSLRDLWVDSVPTTHTPYYTVGYDSSGCSINTPAAQPDPSYYCFATSMYVVSDYQQSDETGGMHEFRYGYQDAIYNSQGRGFQGFRVITEFDLQGNRNTTTTFRQDFPFSGKPIEQDIFRSDGTWISKTTYDWQEADTVGNVLKDGALKWTLGVNGPACYGSNGVVWVQPVKSDTSTFDLGSTSATNPISETVTNYLTGGTGYDADGNSLYVDNTTTDATGTYETTTNLGYRTAQCGIFWTNWVQNKSVTSTVTYNNAISAGINGVAGIGTISRNVTYLANTTLRKLAEEEDDPTTQFEKDTNYNYDSFGNVSSVTVSTPVAAIAAGTYGGLSTAQDYGFASRSTGTTYTSDGYFVSQVTDPMGHASTFDSYDLATGQPTSVHDVNGIPSTYAYDAFGRKIQDTEGRMPTVSISFTAPNSAVLGSAPSGAVYAVNTTQAGYPSHTVFYDLYGKPLREAKDSDQASHPILTDTGYDSLGRVTFTTEPYFSGTPPKSTVDKYDVLNRPLQKTDAEDVVTGYLYSGLSTTVTTTPNDPSFGGATQRVDVETRNSLGKLLSVENAQGADPTADGTTQFRYDAQGNPVLIQDAKSNQTLATYNLLGQKTQVTDPDQGTSTFAYDVLGEMLQQTDAKGQVTMQTYDLLGRMTSRTQPETQPNPTAIWCYDGQSLDVTNPTAGCAGSAGNKAIGKLSAMGQADGYSELYGFDNWARPKTTQTTLPDGTTYGSSVAYDGYDRLAVTRYPGSFPDTAPVVSAALSTGGVSTTVALDDTSGSVTVNLVGTVTVSPTPFATVYSWSQACGANGCGTVAAPNAVNTSFTATAPGVYTFTLSVTDGFLTSSSGSVIVTVLPGTPGRPGLSSDNSADPTTSLDGNLWVSWTAGAGATYYKLYQSQDGGQTFSYLKNESTMSDAFTFMGSSTADITYAYEAQACDSVSGLCSALSSPSRNVIVTYQPQPISGLSVQSVSYGDGSFDVSWTASPQSYVTAYNVELWSYDAETHTYVDEGSGCSSASSSGSPATSCRVPMSAQYNGSVFFSSVQACNVTACGGFYPATPGGKVLILLAPTGVKVSPSPSTNGNFTLSWTAPPYVTYTGYNVYQSYNGGSWTYKGQVTTTNYGFTGQNNGTYSYRVTGCVSSGQCSGDSSTVNETEAWPTGTPFLTSTSAQISSTGSFTLQWTNSGPVTRSIVQESYYSGAWQTIYTGSATSFKVSDPALGKYRFQVQTCNTVGCSAWSNIVGIDVTSSSSGGCTNCAPLAPSGQTASTQTAIAQNSSTTTDNVTPVDDRLVGSGTGALSFSILSPAAHGNVTLIDTAQGRFIYVPTAGYTGPDAFTFQVSDANGTSSAATESVTVTAARTASITAPVSGLALAASPAGTAPMPNVPVADATPAVATFKAKIGRGTALASLARASSGNVNPAMGRVGSKPRRAFAEVHPIYAPPVYQAWANLRLQPVSGTQVMAGLQVAYGYTATGYLNTVTNALSPSGHGAFWTLGSLDAHGHVLSATYGNGAVVTNQYADPMGRITGINTVSAGGTIQNNTYSWYHVGNLASRDWQAPDGVHNPQEQFTYDVLNRLRGATLSGTSSGGTSMVTYAYDVLGNITCKSDVTNTDCSAAPTGYTYGGQTNAGPHAVTAVAGTVNGVANPTYGYDADGNMIARAGTNVVWNSLNLPTCMDASGGSCGSGSTNFDSFSYAPDKHRYQQVSVTSGNSPETTTYVGGLELVSSGSSTDARHRISAYGEDILTLHIGDTDCSGMQGICFDYIHNDHLGGVDAVTDINGAPAGAFGYESFGKRRDPTTGAAPTAGQVQADRALTHRGFTNHEMLDSLNLIHMNGRVYDPALGRFLSVDPVYQAPTNMQSLNPYSYVLNNPLSLTDPTGYAPQCPTDTTCNENGSGKELYDGKNAGNDNGNMTGSRAGFDTGVKGNDVKTLQGEQKMENGGQKPGGGQGTTDKQAQGNQELTPAGKDAGKGSDPQGNQPPAPSVGPCEDGDCRIKDPYVNHRIISVSGGTPKERATVHQALDEIENTPRGKELMEIQLKKNEILLIRIDNSQMFENSKLGGSPVIVNAERSYGVHTTDGDRQVSIVRSVAHEIGHGITGIDDSGPNHMDNINANENPIVTHLQHPEPARTEYDLAWW